MNLNYRPLDYHEHKARTAKATALTNQLRDFGIRSHKARLMTDAEWRMVAGCARVFPPHGDETKEMVYSMLEDAEARALRPSVRDWRKSFPVKSEVILIEGDVNA